MKKSLIIVGPDLDFLDCHVRLGCFGMGIEKIQLINAANCFRT